MAFRQIIINQGNVPAKDPEGVKSDMAMATEVRVKKGEIIDRALRRLKKKLDKEGTLKELRNRRHYEKPSEINRKKKKNRR